MDIGIDLFLFKEVAGADVTASPGRMTFNAAGNFVLLSILLACLLLRNKQLNYVAQGLAIIVAGVSLLALIGYLYGAQPFAIGEKFSTAMALHTTVFFIMAALAALFLQPDSGLMAHVTSDLAGGKVLRRFLPPTIMVPIAIGFLKILGERAHVFSNEFGVSLVAMGNITIITAYFYFISVLLNRSDAKRKALEDETASGRDRLERIINAVAEPIFVKDQEHRWVLCNDAFLAFIGRTDQEIRGKSDYDIFPKEQADVFWTKDQEVFSNGNMVVNEELITDGKGRVKTIVVKKTLYTDSGGGRFVVGVIVDVTGQKQVQQSIEKQALQLEEALKESTRARRIMTSLLEDNYKDRKELETHLVELKRSQNMLIHSEKLASLGRLISEIAHEVNNPLMIISGNAQLSLMSETINPEDKNSFEIIVKECQRAKNVIRRVLRFARPSKGEVKRVEIAQSLEAVVGLLEKQFMLTNSVSIKRCYPDRAIYIRIDELQMHEVFMNLLNNAKEEMTSGGEIVITISLEEAFLRIDFKDTGPGMSEEVLNKVMEPFFTIKETGTGIGLSVCYGIIKAHNGQLRFDSLLGRGTTATILLPMAGEDNGQDTGSR